MQIILLKDVAGVGQRGQVKTVADGFALNSLLPRKAAMLATPQALKDLEQKNAENAAHRAAQEKEWDAIFEKIQKFTLMVRANSDAKGHLYKKIGGEEIAKVLREQLRQLQADGLVKRRALTPARLGVRYALTPYAKTLDPVFGALVKWGMQHLEKRDTAGGTRIARPAGPVSSPTKEIRV